MRDKITFFRVICLVMCVILAASLIVTLDYEKYNPFAPSYVPSPSDPDTPAGDGGGGNTTQLGLCKDFYNHKSHNLDPIPYCMTCETYYYSLDDIDIYCIETCGFAACYSTTCKNCGGDMGQVVETCCFVEGQCHICGNVCEHVCNSLDYCYIRYLIGHPLANVQFPFDFDQSYVIDGTCMLCFAAVE